jgi:hypothetical protein
MHAAHSRRWGVHVHGYGDGGLDDLALLPTIGDATQGGPMEIICNHGQTGIAYSGVDV